MNSNGAAYADADGDGDLDLVVNNLDEPAGIHENHAGPPGQPPDLRVRLRPMDGRTAWGAQVTVRTQSGEQYQELSPVRGYQGCVEPVPISGWVPTTTEEDRGLARPRGPGHHAPHLPDGGRTTLVVDQRSAVPHCPPPRPAPVPRYGPGNDRPAPCARGNPYDDFRLEVLLPTR